MPGLARDVLYSHPDINMAGVVQFMDGDKERVKAFLVAEPGAKELSRAEIKAYCKDKLAPYKIPTIIEYKEDLPRTVVGKVSRKDLRVPDTAAPDLKKEVIKK